MLDWTDFICTKDKWQPKNKLGRNLSKTQEEILRDHWKRILPVLLSNVGVSKVARTMQQLGWSALVQDNI